MTPSEADVTLEGLRNPIRTRGDSEQIEKGLEFMPKFDGAGLIPCITQDAETLNVLMFAFMNEQALRLTISTGFAHYYSRSRGKLWKKGETSGHLQKVLAVRVDCDQDVLLLRVEQTEAACHVGYRSCFFRELDKIGEYTDGSLRVVEVAPVFDPSSVYGKT
jgi:phosphoribosyl-AMP cyclohydrolase